MPRAKKTMAGMQAQPIGAITGQTYGEGVRQENLQRSMPSPSEPTMRASSQPQVETQAETPTQMPRMSLADAMASITGSGGLLREPDANPTVPVTDGLPTGPGRGPEMSTYGNPLGNTLRRLARETGDTVFVELASRARL